MNKKYGIGFLIVFILMIGLLFLAYRISYRRALEKYEREENYQRRYFADGRAGTDEV